MSNNNIQDVVEMYERVGEALRDGLEDNGDGFAIVDTEDGGPGVCYGCGRWSERLWLFAQRWLCGECVDLLRPLPGEGGVSVES